MTTKTLDLSPEAAAHLAQKIAARNAAQQALDEVFTALCYQLGAPNATGIVSVSGHQLTVQVPDPVPEKKRK